MTRPPNIVWIMADDHAATAVSAYGGRLAGVFRTPNIDRLAAEGARFTNAFCTNAICTPSRAVMLTGVHSHVNGVRTLSDALSPALPTYPAALRRAGYRTAVIGKWHLHSEPRGFDHYEVLPAHGTYRDPRFLDPSFDWSEFTLDGAERLGRRHRGHVTDLITEKCLRWIAAGDAARPFLLLCHHKAPHDDFEYQERFEHLLDGIAIPEPDSLWEDRSHRSEGSRDYGSSVSERNPVRSAVHRMSQWDYPTGRLDVRCLSHDDRTRAAYRKYLRDYLRTVNGLDESVGAILAALERGGVTNDTVVVYTSDQGMFLGEHDYIDKRWIFDEALRLPLLVRYPRRVRPGLVIDQVVSNLDFAPTLLDLAGVAVPATVQGRSMMPLLDGAEDGGAGWPDELYYRFWMHLTDHDTPAHFGIRTRQHKLIFFYGLPLDTSDGVPEPTPPAWELYDLDRDPGETRNVYHDPAYAGTVRRLEARLRALRREAGDEDLAFPEIAERMAATSIAGLADGRGPSRAAASQLTAARAARHGVDEWV
jgi:arylsulfatase A-like enzyme